jgi:hypothetical protein
MLAFLKVATAVAAIGTAGYLAVGHSQSSVGGVSVAGPVCIKQTAQPGNSYTVTANIVNAGGAPAKIDLSTNPVVGQPVGPPYPAGGHPIPRSWVTVSGPYNVAAHATARAPLTIGIPAGARRGRYGTMLYATTYGTPGASGNQVAFGAGAGVYLQLSVGVSPPPRAFCTGQRDSYWPQDPPFTVCKPHQPPGRLGVCRVLPLPPPVANARNCHETRAQWAAYMHQLRLGGIRYAHGNPRAYLYAAHCFVDGRILNTAIYYEHTGMYRYADGQHSSVMNARPVNNPDSWRTAGTR